MNRSLRWQGVRGDRLFLDSTLVAAHADLGGVGSRELIRSLPAVSKHVAELWEENLESVSVATVGLDPPPSAPASVGVDDRDEVSTGEMVREQLGESGE